MKFIAWLVRLILLVAEKVFSELALLAGLFSSTEGGTYFDRAIGGMLDNFWAIYAFARAFVTNVKFTDFMVGFDAAIDEGLAAVTLNVETNSRMVLAGMFITYITWKVIAYVLKLIRKHVLKKRKKDDDESVKRPTQGEARKTYEHLYEEKPRVHTPITPQRNPQG